MSWKMELDLTLGFWARASEVKKKANQPAAMSCSVVITRPAILRAKRVVSICLAVLTERKYVGCLGKAMLSLSLTGLLRWAENVLHL